MNVTKVDTLAEKKVTYAHTMRVNIQTSGEQSKENE